ncbi:e9imm peptide [Streptomyces sp. NPDC055105]|uniref:e9imm peptide n=1 Tax=Streptomyces sp. NPDC055105 TaxID=3365719 RepID=UPI0037D44A77
MSRDEAIKLVQRLMDVDYGDETEETEALAALERGLACPHVSDYIFWDTDPQLTAEKIVNRALEYKPFAL